jgi:dTDP-glucose 4,6-dehydratase
MRSILVTGGAGFIGSHFVDLLLATYSDYRVVVLDKLTYAGNRENLRDAFASDRLKFVRGDVRDLELDRSLLRTYHCDAVVHFAAESHVERSTENPLLFASTNATGTITLLEAARLEGGVKRFLLVSSVEVYGPCAEFGSPWREDDPIYPPTPYAAAKAAAEHWAFAYWKSYDLPVVISRCANNYGPRQYPEKQLPTFISAARQGKPLPVYGEGKPLRQWLYVEDHCRALDLLLHADARQVVGEIFNVGGGPEAERTTLQNARAVLKRFGRDEALLRFVPDRVPSIHRLALDASKLERRLGWKPQIGFDEGLERTLAFYAPEAVGTPSAALPAAALLESA